MKQIIGHRITIAFTAFALALSIIWYFKEPGFEPIIGATTLLGILIVEVFFNVQLSKDSSSTGNQGNAPSEERPTITKTKNIINNKGAGIVQQNISSNVTNHNTFPKK